MVHTSISIENFYINRQYSLTWNFEVKYLARYEKSNFDASQTFPHPIRQDIKISPHKHHTF